MSAWKSARGRRPRWPTPRRKHGGRARRMNKSRLPTPQPRRPSLCRPRSCVERASPPRHETPEPRRFAVVATPPPPPLRRRPLTRRRRSRRPSPAPLSQSQTRRWSTTRGRGLTNQSSATATVAKAICTAAIAIRTLVASTTFERRPRNPTFGGTSLGSGTKTYRDSPRLKTNRRLRVDWCDFDRRRFDWHDCCFACRSDCCYHHYPPRLTRDLKHPPRIRVTRSSQSLRMSNP
mmetsp:Transcript_13442/g.44464  ORF Transcript_13442/g.44464 Transcript_13442/m.44464 type:complete len:234 (+) Transcript_13442:2222-2923(+)